MNQVPIGIFWKDSDHRYLGCNGEFARMEGFESTDSIIGKTDSDLYVDSATVESFRRLEHFRVTDDSYTLIPDDETVYPDSRFYDKTKVPLKKEAGEVVGILGTIEDVTAYHILRTREDQPRQQLMHTQKLESIGALCGGIAHEFNNILVGVLGNADYLRLRLSSDIKGQKNISGIIESPQRASQLVQQDRKSTV